MFRLRLAVAGGALAVLGALGSSGCESRPKPAPAAPPVTSAIVQAPAPSPKAERYGAPLGAGKALPIASVLSGGASYEGKSLIVEGEVRRACTRKGCWMELSESTETNTPGCRVTFKDYGFFVPTNSGGAHAKVEGVVEVEKVAASHVKHLEEEGATFAKKAPDGTAEEVRLVATGVELTHR
jgi:hypothetical protein